LLVLGLVVALISAFFADDVHFNEHRKDVTPGMEFMFGARVGLASTSWSVALVFLLMLGTLAALPIVVTALIVMLALRATAADNMMAVYVRCMTIVLLTLGVAKLLLEANPWLQTVIWPVAFGFGILAAVVSECLRRIRLSQSSKDSLRLNIEKIAARTVKFCESVYLPVVPVYGSFRKLLTYPEPEMVTN